jgi:hypothetical protein
MDHAGPECLVPINGEKSSDLNPGKDVNDR